MKVTAETITDEQIRREFCMSTDPVMRAKGNRALHGRSDMLRRRARQRCADAWNARHGGDK